MRIRYRKRKKTKIVDLSDDAEVGDLAVQFGSLYRACFALSNGRVSWRRIKPPYAPLYVFVKALVENGEIYWTG